MTELEKLTMLQSICGDSDATPEILETYLKLAEDVVVRRAYPYLQNYILATVPKRYETLQVQIANELYLHRGAEGEQGHSENGIVRSYENGFVSDTLLKQITPFGRTLNEKIPVDIGVVAEIDSFTLAVGESEKIYVHTNVMTSDNTTLEIDEGYKYESNDVAIMTVSADGIITAIAPGDAIISITGNKSDETTSLEITVSE